MAEAAVVAPRPDVDIAADIQHLVRRYPPMTNDRRHMRYSVENGVVTLEGYVKTPITRRYIHETVRQITGVQSVETDGLYNDEAIRLAVGQVIPIGVQVNVEYGHVILTGHLPQGAHEAALLRKVEAVPGVREVHTRFMKQV